MEAMDTAPGDPAAVWEAFTGIESVFASSGLVRYWFQLSGLMDTALIVWVILFLMARRDEIVSDKARQASHITTEPTSADMEPHEPWIRPVRVRVRIRQRICPGLGFLCGWLGTLLLGRWSFSLFALVLTVALMTPGCVMFIRSDASKPAPASDPTVEPEPTMEPVHIPARVPPGIL